MSDSDRPSLGPVTTEISGEQTVSGRQGRVSTRRSVLRSMNSGRVSAGNARRLVLRLAWDAEPSERSIVKRLLAIGLCVVIAAA